MGYIHKVDAVERTARQRRIARMVSMRMRRTGMDVVRVPVRDAYGARVWPFDLVINGVAIAVRSVSDVIHNEAELQRIAQAHYRGHYYVQRGAADLGALVEFMRAHAVATLPRLPWA